MVAFAQEGNSQQNHRDCRHHADQGDAERRSIAGQGRERGSDSRNRIRHLCLSRSAETEETEEEEPHTKSDFLGRNDERHERREEDLHELHWMCFSLLPNTSTRLRPPYKANRQRYTKSARPQDSTAKETAG